MTASPVRPPRDRSRLPGRCSHTRWRADVDAPLCHHLREHAAALEAAYAPAAEIT